MRGAYMGGAYTDGAYKGGAVIEVTTMGRVITGVDVTMVLPGIGGAATTDGVT